MRLKSELYKKEQDDIIDKIISILDLENKNKYTLYELDNCEEIQTKIIAVPAAYLLIMAAVDFKSGFTFKNILSIIAGFMFALILELLIRSQSAVLRYTKQEIGNTTSAIKEKANANFLQEFVDSLENLMKSISHQHIYLLLFRLIVWSVPVILVICTLAKCG